MARRYGSSLSSLVNSARSAYERQQSLNDQIKAYEWDLSGKTAQDADAYMKYLTDRGKTLQTTDPAKALSFQQKITSVQRAFSTAEISRASLAINYGQGSDADKYKKIVQLAQHAYESGDEALGARLEMQASTLQIKMQNAGGGSAAGGGGSTEYKARLAGIKDEVSQAKLADTKLEQAFKDGLIDKGKYIAAKLNIAHARDQAYNAAKDSGLRAQDVQKLSNEQQAWATGDGKKWLDQGAKLAQYRPDLTSQNIGPNGVKPGDASVIGYDRISLPSDKRAQDLNAAQGKGPGQGYILPSSVGQIATGKVPIDKALTALGVSNGPYFNPLTNETGNYQVFANDYTNPQYAYTRDAKGVFYLVNKDGTLTPMKDVNQSKTGTVEVAPDQLKAYQNKNGFGSVGSISDTNRTKGTWSAIGQGASSFGKQAGISILNGLTLGAGNTLSNLLDVSTKLRAKTEAKKAADIAEGKRMFAEQQAALVAAQQAQAARAAKIAAAPVNDYWAAAPYRDQPLIANPTSPSQVAYNIASQTGLKIPKL